jgi:hypothetical protein
VFSPMAAIARALSSPWRVLGISYAFSWTYAFLSSLSADQS